MIIKFTFLILNAVTICKIKIKAKNETIKTKKIISFIIKSLEHKIEKTIISIKLQKTRTQVTKLISLYQNLLIIKKIKTGKQYKTVKYGISSN
jgi:hypothetical protein